MTTQYSANVQKIIDATTRSSEIGDNIGKAILANGFDAMTKANKETLIICFEAALTIMTDLVDWYNGDRSYESWLAMFIKANTNKKWMSIDKTGELTTLAEEIITNGDLAAYFDEVVVTLDLANVPDGIQAITEVLEFVHTRGTID